MNDQERLNDMVDGFIDDMQNTTLKEKDDEYFKFEKLGLEK